jgi:uncharacterized protein (DUF1330 family)
MTLYVVIWHMEETSSHIIGIFKDYENAIACINNSKYSKFLEIEEYELDKLQ